MLGAARLARGLNLTIAGNGADRKPLQRGGIVAKTHTRKEGFLLGELSLSEFHSFEVEVQPVN